MLKKLVFKSQSATQLIIAGIGSVIGLFIMVGAIQFYLDYTSAAFGGKDLLRDGFVMQRQVGTLNSLNMGSTSFSDEDMEDIRSQPFVEELAIVRSTKFKVLVGVGEKGGRIPPFLIQMFFQSVPDKYLERVDGFEWEPGDTLVPIILPIEYLNLYNYGFATSQGIPQLSEDAFSAINMNVEIGDKPNKVQMKARVAGFTAKFSTILVPDKFIQHYNEQLGDPEETKKIERLFAIVNSKYHSDFVEWIGENAYSVNQEKLKTSEEKAKFRIILSILLFVASLIILLAVLIFVQYAKLFIWKAVSEIRLLIHLGYNYMTIASQYIRYFVMIFSVITGITLIVSMIGKLWLNGYMQDNLGIEVTGGLDIWAYLIMLAFFMLYSLIIILSVKRIIKRLAGYN